MNIIVILLISFSILSAFPASSEAVQKDKNKRIVFGGDSSLAPYEFIDKNGNPAGFCVDLTKAVADELGWAAEIKLGELSDIRKKFESGEIDIIERASYSYERSKLYEYSVPYHEFRYTIFLNHDDLDNFRHHNLDELSPVAQKGSYTAEYIRKYIPGKEIKETDRLIEVLSHISVKKKSYTILNKYLGIYLIKQYAIENVTPAGDPILEEGYYYQTLKKNADLITDLNEGLNILKINGRYKKIYDQWFSIIEKDKKAPSALKIILIIFIPIILMYIIIFAWSWSLKTKIKIQTVRLSDELERHKYSELALMESEERSRLIIENAPIGIFHFNLNGEITTCNDSFIKIMGSSREKLTGFNILQFPENNMYTLVKSAINGIQETFEGFYESVSGENTTHMRATFTPIKLSDGSITGGLGIIEDNTARKKYEEALLSAKDTAESANSIKSDFLANMSHEVRTPLNGILGMLQLIQTTGVNDEQANYINIAIKSGMRLTRLLNDILDLSRVESDKLVLTETQFSLGNIIGFISERYEQECREKGVNLIISISEETPDEIVGDETRIRQILVNLVSNAVKFTKSGNIFVKITAEEVSCYGEINIIISVNDTGIGISDDILNQIFEPFKQGENSYRRTFQGAGLGLTLVKHLVHLMNGTIKINSKPGKGTSIECTITVKLPENHSIVLKPVLNEKINKSGNLCTILIAEDERINRLALKRILEKSGYRILEAENGLDALKVLETENPDCILMDIQMPEMDGIEASKHIRNDEKFRDKSHIPIIALTAYTMPEDREKINDAGLDDYISKPVNMDYLLKSVARFVES